jgi:2-dehydro-3-deoxygluconokinase
MTGRPASDAPSFIALGECMIEMAQQENGLYRRGFAGDTFNAAWYARRLLPADWSVSYGTCVGEDAASDEMTVFMADEGVALDAIRRIPGRTVGLYMIDLTEGERSFSYWRGQSAARLLGEDAAWLERMLAGRRVVHFSGITLAILSDAQRERLVALMHRVRQAGGQVAFDGNYRPRLWASPDDARRWTIRALAASTIALPSVDDELALFGDADEGAALDRLVASGPSEIVLKRGSRGPVVAVSGERTALPSPEAKRVLDTTAAGDSFNAGYLAARLSGAGPVEAARSGHALACQVIGHVGAILPRDVTLAR